MKQKMRNHIRACGQVTGFLSHYHTLSCGELIQSAEAVFTDYCLECGHGFQRYFSLPPNAQCHQLTCAGCERYQLFLEGWEMGKTQAELAFETADLTLFETIGNLAAWTRPSSTSELLQDYC